MVDNKTRAYIFSLYLFAAITAVIASKMTGQYASFWYIIPAGLLAIAIYFSINPDKMSMRSYEDPDRHPFQDIPGQEIIPGEQLYA